MRNLIWVLLLLAAMAVYWEYAQPAKPADYLIAEVYDMPVVENVPTTGVVTTNTNQPNDQHQEPFVPTRPFVRVISGVQQVASFTGVEGIVYTVLSGSQINWKGAKVGGTHRGTVEVSSGRIVVEDGEIQAGYVIIDMESITSTDVASEDLDIHLKSDEFFAVESYPEARLDIIEASESELFGLMRIRGEEKLVRFPVVITIDEDTVTTITQFALDRTHWGVRGGLPAVSEYIEFDLRLIWKSL